MWEPLWPIRLSTRTIHLLFLVSLAGVPVALVLHLATFWLPGVEPGNWVGQAALTIPTWWISALIAALLNEQDLPAATKPPTANGVSGRASRISCLILIAALIYGAIWMFWPTSDPAQSTLYHLRAWTGWGTVFYFRNAVRMQAVWHFRWPWE
jgi:hypothetical protein